MRQKSKFKQDYSSLYTEDELKDSLDNTRIESVEKKAYEISKKLDAMNWELNSYKAMINKKHINIAMYVFIMLSTILCFLLGCFAMKFGLLDFVF